MLSKDIFEGADLVVVGEIGVVWWSWDWSSLRAGAVGDVEGWASWASW